MFIKVLVIPDTGNPRSIRLDAERIAEVGPNGDIIGETVCLWIDGPMARQYRCKMTMDEWDRILPMASPTMKLH